MLKVYRAILAFYKATIIPMARWCFLRVGFRLNQKNILAPLTMTGAEIRERIVVPELSLEEFVFSALDEAVRAAERPTRQRTPIPGPTEFRICLKAYVGTVVTTCPFYVYREVQGDREEGKNS
jgi:hypothetical protein